MEEAETTFDLKLCHICSQELKEPYIKCCVCTVPQCLVCRLCFSKGLESGLHENNHSYEIMRNDFPLWDDNWTAAEELQLLEAIDECGLGNWTGVAKYVKRSPQACESHYWQTYVDCPKSPLLAPPVPTQSQKTIHQFPIPYKVCDAPPRPNLGSQLQADMAGYSAARGDFVTEYDNYAEMSLRDLDFSDEDDEVERELKIAGVEIYNNHLRERACRKKIIRDYGLIDIRRTIAVFKRFTDVLGQFVTNSLKPLMRLLPPEDFESFLESENYEHELRYRITVLKEYRAAGLTKFGSVKMYRKLKRRRENNWSSRGALKEVIMNLKIEGNPTQWINNHLVDNTNSLQLPISNLPRRVAPPLVITGYPGYEKLNDKERELCSTVRLPPDGYLEFKQSLVNECHRNGHLKLAQARQLIKIDVNKTRKIYDFLIEEGIICKES